MWTWGIAALATAGVIIRPFGWPEFDLGGGGRRRARRSPVFYPGPMTRSTGIGKGTDVYLFLTGMMLLSEIAREEGLFDWLAAVATRRAKGSPKRSCSC